MPQSKFAALRKKTGLTLAQLAPVLGYSQRALYRWENGEVEPREPVLYQMRQILDGKSMYVGPPRFRFIDLFAGIGGLRRGFESVGGRCVYTSEWNTYAQLTYAANFGCDHKIDGDITKVPVEAIPDHDVLLAGFPCQPFSIAGVSKKKSLGREHGFRDETQGTLFFDVCRIIEAHQPAAFLLENVKNLVSHDRGRTFEVIERTLTEELGYNVSYRIIDAKAFVPQHRERIFIVGFRDGSEFDLDNLALPDADSGPKVAEILHPQDKSEAGDERNARYLEGLVGRVSSKYTLSDKLWDYLQAYREKHLAKGNGFGFGLVHNPEREITRTLSARYYKDGSEILISQRGKNPRRLTPRECARLMGFDRPGGSGWVIPVSDTQAYKQFGNAVVVPVVEEIARGMAPHIVSALQGKQPRQGELYGHG